MPHSRHAMLALAPALPSLAPALPSRAPVRPRAPFEHTRLRVKELRQTRQPRDARAPTTRASRRARCISERDHRCPYRYDYHTSSMTLTIYSMMVTMTMTMAAALPRTSRSGLLLSRVQFSFPLHLPIPIPIPIPHERLVTPVLPGSTLRQSILALELLLQCRDRRLSRSRSGRGAREVESPEDGGRERYGIVGSNQLQKQAAAAVGRNENEGVDHALLGVGCKQLQVCRPARYRYLRG